jgi:ATP-dependent helicase STH1/SNF2
MLKLTGVLTPNQWKAENERIFTETAAVSPDHQAIELRQKHYHRSIEDLSSSNSRLHDNRCELTVESSLENASDFSQMQIDLRLKTIDSLLASNIMTREAQARLRAEASLLRGLDSYRLVSQQVFGDLWDRLPNLPRVQPELRYLDRSQYILPKPQISEEEKANLPTRQDQEKRKLAKQKEYTMKLFEFTADFVEYHKWRARTAKRRLANVKLRVDWLGKTDSNDREREERERIEAFKDKKFDIYADLLKRARKERVMQILEETDNFLKELACKVLESKKKIDPAFKVDDEVINWLSHKNEEYDVNKSTLMNDNYTKFYYNLTHTNTEEVSVKPSLLEGGQLKKYQQAGLSWMVSLYNNKLNGILADEMGLGKTIQTIALLCHLMEFKQNYGPFLIVVPLTTISNWVLEFNKWAPSIKKLIFKGNPSQRKQLSHVLRNTKWNVCLTTYEYVLKDKSDLNRFQWQYIIVDEGHKMKNPKSKFAQTLGQLYNSEHRLLLTGTPLQNNLQELWSLLNFLLPDVFHSCDDFEKWFKMPLKKYGVTDKEIELSEEHKMLLIHRFHQVLRPFLLRRVKKEVESELPNKIEYIIKVELSGWQKIIYNQIDEKQCLALDPSHGRIGKKALMNMMMQKRKICDHPYLFVDGDFEINEDLVRSSGKLEVLDRILPKLIRAGHRVLIFTQMTRLMDILEVFFEYRQIRVLRLDGTTKHEDRVDRIDAFNKEDSEYSVFILSTRAGGVGLNLQSADTVIFIDSDWNPQMDRQAQDRVHRIGQKREVRVFRLVTNTETEETILSKACFKKSLDDMIIQAGLFNQKSTEVERRGQIEEMIKRHEADDFEEDSDIPNDQEINRMLARNEFEIDLYDEMDRLRYDQARLEGLDADEYGRYRLMTEAEVPEWVKFAEEEKEQRLTSGKRRTKLVNHEMIHMESLDDDEYFLALEARLEANEKREKSNRMLPVDVMKKDPEDDDSEYDIEGEEGPEDEENGDRQASDLAYSGQNGW